MFDVMSEHYFRKVMKFLESSIGVTKWMELSMDLIVIGKHLLFKIGNKNKYNGLNKTTTKGKVPV